MVVVHNVHKRPALAGRLFLGSVPGYLWNVYGTSLAGKGDFTPREMNFFF